MRLHWEEFTVQGGEDPDRHSLYCHEEPRLELLEAFQRLIPPFMELLELPAEYAGGLVVTGVSFSYTKRGRGVVLTALKSLEHFDDLASINTPLCMEIDAELESDLEHLEAEAERYLQGERRQMALFKGVETAVMDNLDRAAQQEPQEEEERNITLSTGGRSVTLSQSQLERAAEGTA